MSNQRPEYRDSKIPKSVCVYTIAQESRYLMIENLSTAGNVKEFVSHCQKFGRVEKYECLDTHSSSNEYFDVILLKFDLVSSARYAKRKLDNKPYDYQLLRANYAPEYETAEDIRVKFQDRLLSVTKRLRPKYYNKRIKDKTTIKDNEDDDKADNSIADMYGPFEKPVEKTTTKKRRRI